MPTTPRSTDLPSDVDPYLGEILARLEGLLRGDLLGAYLIGSLAMGGYVPGRSDIDVAVVLGAAGDRSQMRTLVDQLAHPTLVCPAPKLELVVYPRSALRGPHPSLDWILNLNTGPEVETRATYEPDAEPRHWFVLDVAMARDHARSLAGPAPASVFPDLDQERVLTALLASLEWHEANDERGIGSVLNASRATRYVVTGTWSTKQEAAAWARGAGPDPQLVATAAALHERGTDDELDRDRVAAFLQVVGSTVARAREGRLRGEPAD